MEKIYIQVVAYSLIPQCLHKIGFYTHFDVAKYHGWRTEIQLVYLGIIFSSWWSYFTKYTETMQRKHRVSPYHPLSVSALISQGPAYLLFTKFLSHAHRCPNNSAFISSTLFLIWLSSQASWLTPGCHNSFWHDEAWGSQGQGNAWGIGQPGKVNEPCLKSQNCLRL